MALHKELSEIKKRNARVEADKAWELSHTRRFLITLFIYLVSLAIFLLINAPNPFVNAAIPALAYGISTTTLSFFKSLWLTSMYKR